MAESETEMHRCIKKRKTNASGNAEDVDIGASGSKTVLTKTNFDGSGSSPTETNNSTSTGNCYEVFLSFRGPDTRDGFADHLYHGLLNAGIHAFRDDDELRQGENIKPELLAAIRNSKISIPIFSVNYGRSSWCLDELVQIMECKNNNGQIVLPIFYKVKPDEVRYQTGGFGKEFNVRKESSLGRSSFNPAILEKWKQALFDVSNLKGYEADGPEGELVQSVVRKVLSELKKKFKLIISKNLVGIDSHVKNVMELLDDRSHARLFVGIHGMGGIGKTTLAKTIYNKLSNQFEHCSFIADIRESWKRGAHVLQNQLIYDISNEKNEVHNKDGGINFISSRFKYKKVLLLLDDVDDVDQVSCLAGNHDWFSLGSIIIITSRNKRILEVAGVDHNHELTELDYEQSLILFSKHAFRKDFPPSDFEGLTREVVSTTGGLPLSLEVLGSLFCGKKLASWRGTIDKLKKVPPKTVEESLKISIEELDHQQKEIFLDIACFFIGFDKNITSYMWDACNFFPEEGIEVLIFMSLIKVGDDHKLRMHDQLRDLGRKIVCEENQREPRYRSRLWDHEEVQEVMKYNKGTEKIEGIDLGKGYPAVIGIAKRDGDIYKGKQFKNLMSLRFLHLNGAHLSGDFNDSMEKLRWLRWPHCPMNFEVNNFHVEKLVVLELSLSKINEKWEGWSFFMMAEKLKYLDLSYCELENMDCLSAFKKLEVLILDCCRRLKQIDASIGDMEALICLKLYQCTSLTELPIEIGKLKALQQLDLSSTTSLSALPNSIGSLENLEILSIMFSGIEELPNGIGRLRKLRELRTFGCENLERAMAESLCNLSSLQSLNFCHCYKLQSLPDLPYSLTELKITCISRKLPSFSYLTHLKSLEFNSCKFLECIPELPSTLLKNSECSQLTDVEESESTQSLNTPFKLESLHFTSCQSIKTLDVSQFIHLRSLVVSFCYELLEVRGLDKLIYLENLSIRSEDSIKWLDLSKLEGLKRLYAGNCKNLSEIQGLDRCEYLQELNIEGCTSIKRLDLLKSRGLKKLDVGGCKNLVEIQGLDRLEFLEELNISKCTSIGRLILPTSGSLKVLDASSFKTFAEIQGLDRLAFLETLCISRWTLIGGLLLAKSKSLKILVVTGCKNLVEVEGLDGLEFLEILDVSRCTSIKRLLLPKSKSFKELHAIGCKNLTKIQGLDRLEFLEKLDISQCTSIGRLLLPISKSLKEIDARDCKNLVEIQGLNMLKCLEYLNIIRCESLITIPELPGTRIYQHYETTDNERTESGSDYTDETTDNERTESGSDYTDDSDESI